MKIGIITDLHANLPALEKIMEYYKDNSIEQIIHIGDVIGIGPFPVETLDYMMSINNCEMLLGNHENYQIKKFPNNISISEFQHQNWIKCLLEEKHLNWIKTFPKILSKEFNGIKFTFLHSIYDEENNDFTDIPFLHLDKLEDYFKDIQSDVIFYGHSHFMQINKYKKELCNPGASGCSKNNETQFIILTITEKKYKIEHIKMEYNKKQLLNEYKAKNVHGKEEILNIFY